MKTSLSPINWKISSGTFLSPNRIANRSFIPGTVGAFFVVAMSFLAYRLHALEKGWNIGGRIVGGTPEKAALFVLVAGGFLMFGVELYLAWQRERNQYFSVSPKITAGRIGAFLGECLLEYAANLALLYVVIGFFKHAGVYGFQKDGAYFHPWFTVLDYMWELYVWGAPLYILATRALHASPEADEKDPSMLLKKSVALIGQWFGKQWSNAVSFNARDRIALLGIMVKIYFAPLMTVFFVDYFHRIINYWSAVCTTIPKLLATGSYTHAQANSDIYMALLTAIFLIDVSVSWAGYLFSSRWTKNQMFSVEPTLLGWLVTILCYPPFSKAPGTYLIIPTNEEFITLPMEWLVTILAVISILGHLVYVFSTMCLGIRFSNLTHRGLVKVGPYGLVRHPAYAGKVLAWVCTGFPLVLYQFAQNPGPTAFYPFFGLLFTVYIYYMRALTEERHLGAIDPEYANYCRTVRYRFIPGIF